MQLQLFLEELRARMEERGIPFVALPIAIVIIVGLVAGFFLLQGPSTTSFRLRVFSGEQPISGAVVEVFDEQGNFIASATSANGIASFDSLPAKKLVFKVKKGEAEVSRILDLARATISSVDLAAAAVTATPSPGAKLVPPPAVQGPPLGSASLAGLQFAGETNGKATVVVKDDLNRAVEGAEVKLFDSSDGGATSPLASAVTVKSGIVSFKDLPVGAKVYAVVTATGFLSFDGSAEPKEVPDSRKGSARFQVRLTRATGENSGEASILVIDGENKTTPARIVVSSSLNKPIVDNETQGSLTITLEKGAAHFVSVYAKGFLPAFDELNAGDSKTISLTGLDASNSANLTVKVFDEQKKPVSGASVSLFFENGPIIPITSSGDKTNSNGSLKITGLRKDSIVKIAVSKGTRFNDDTIAALIDSENDVEVNLVLYPASLLLSAVNPLSNDSVAASFTVFSGNLTIATCTSTASPCTASVVANIPLKIAARASGFFDFPEFDVKLSPDESRTVQLPMVPINAVENTLVNFVGLFNARGEKVTNAELGSVVNARFQVVSAVGERAGLFVRVGESAEAGISGHSPTVGFYGGSGFDCGGSEEANYDGTTYKWVDLFYDATRPASTLFSIDIDVSPTADKTVLEIFYRTYLYKNGQWLRNPFDSQLGSAESTAQKQGCLAEAYKASFPIGAPNTVCSERACVSTTYEQEQFGVAKEGGFGFKAYSLADCVSGSEISAACSRGLLQANFKIQDFFRNPSSLTATVNPSHVSIMAIDVETYDGRGGKIRRTFAFNAAGSVTVDLKTLLAGIAYRGVVEGTVFLAPKASSTGTPVTVSFNNGGSKDTVYTSFIEVGAPTGPVEIPPVTDRFLVKPPVGAVECITSEEGTVAVDAHPDAGILLGCNHISLAVDPIFPADAVPLRVKNPEITLRVSSSDESDKCYQLDLKEGVLKYNTERAGCPDKFKVHSYKGNVINGSKAVLLLQYRNDFKTVNLTVSSIPLNSISRATREGSTPPSSLEAVQVADLVSGIPQNSKESGIPALKQVLLVALINNKQLGSIAADLVDKSESPGGFTSLQRAAFNGPGVQSYAVVSRVAERQLSLWRGLTNVGNVPGLPKQALNQKITNFRADIAKIANASAFRRSSESVIWCKGEDPLDPENECRPSLADWLSFENQTQEQRVKCDGAIINGTKDVFCNQAFTENGLLCNPALSEKCTSQAIPKFDFDERCDPATSLATIDVGYFYLYPGENRRVQCGISSGCKTECEICDNLDCNPACRPENNYTIQAGVGDKVNNGFGDVICSSSSAFYVSSINKCRIPCFNHCERNYCEESCEDLFNGNGALGGVNTSCSQSHYSRLTKMTVECACVSGSEDACNVPCSNWKGVPNCNPECDKNGTRPVEVSFSAQSWVNTTPLVPVRLGLQRTVVGSPFKYFQNETVGKAFTYYDVIDMSSSAAGSQSFSVGNVRLTERNCLDNNGVYVLKGWTTDGVDYFATADPLDLKAAAYTGAACSKARDVKLCSKIFVDHRSIDDVCVNSVSDLRNAQQVYLGDFPNGVDSTDPATGGEGTGIKLDKDKFAVLKNGYVVFGTDDKNDEDCNKVRVTVFDDSGSNLGKQDVSIWHAFDGYCKSGCWVAQAIGWVVSAAVIVVLVVLALPAGGAAAAPALPGTILVQGTPAAAALAKAIGAVSLLSVSLTGGGTLFFQSPAEACELKDSTGGWEGLGKWAGYIGTLGIGAAVCEDCGGGTDDCSGREYTTLKDKLKIKTNKVADCYGAYSST